MTSPNMHALVYHGPGKKAWEQRPRPSLLKPTDAIVRITTTTLCGTDLHILKGEVSTVTAGRVLGHEGVGIIDETGPHVSHFKRGDKVLISCITSCGNCAYCKRGMYSHCTNGGWILGNTIDGTQAEYVRIPYADHSLYLAPAGVSEDALVMFSDILPTGYECGVLRGQVKPGDSVAIVGSGPVGLAALITAKMFSPLQVIMVDLDDNRLRTAAVLGATHVVKAAGPESIKAILALTGNLGVDVAIEAVGAAATFDICQAILAPGGHLANIGVHGDPVTLHMEKLWDRNIDLSTQLVDASSTALLLKMLQVGELDAKPLVSHRLKLAEVMKGYEIFSHAAKEHALKVVLSA